MTSKDQEFLANRLQSLKNSALPKHNTFVNSSVRQTGLSVANPNIPNSFQSHTLQYNMKPTSKIDLQYSTDKQPEIRRFASPVIKSNFIPTSQNEISMTQFNGQQQSFVERKRPNSLARTINHIPNQFLEVESRKPDKVSYFQPSSQKPEFSSIEPKIISVFTSNMDTNKREGVFEFYRNDTTSAYPPNQETLYDSRLPKRSPSLGINPPPAYSNNYPSLGINPPPGYSNNYLNNFPSSNNFPTSQLPEMDFLRSQNNQSILEKHEGN